MANIPEDLKYSNEHEWIRQTDEEGVVEVGITEYAQSELGDIVYLELPGVGDSVRRTQSFGTIEAVKAVSELYAPVSGEVVAVNEELDASPALVNSDPYGEGWMVRIRLSAPGDLDDLLDAAAYGELVD